LLYAVLYAAGIHGVRRWRPRLVLRPRRAAGHFAFGAKSTGAQMLFQFYSNVDYQVVGRVFGDAALGIYRVAYELILYPVHFLSGITVDVAFPSFARLRTEPARLAAQFLRFARQNLLVTLPVVALVLVEADDLLVIFFPSCVGGATVARVLCAVGLLRSMSLVFPPLFDGVGRPGANLAVASAASLLMPGAFVAGALILGPRLGMLSVALAWAVVYPFVFAGLLRFGLSLLALRRAVYLRQVAATIGLAGVLTLPLLALRWALGGWAPGPRLAVLAVVMAAAVAIWRPWRSTSPTTPAGGAEAPS
jgi:O-antigen/teichoic acid export membrane protein